MFDKIDWYYICATFTKVNAPCTLCRYCKLCKVYTDNKAVTYNDLETMTTTIYAEGEI